MLQKIHVDIYTYNKSKKRKRLEDAETSRLKRSEKENTATDLFLDVCYLLQDGKEESEGSNKLLSQIDNETSCRENTRSCGNKGGL